MIMLFDQSFIVPKSPFTKDKTIPNNTAQPKLATKNPGTTDDTNIIIKALITKLNKPNVKILIGKVNNVTTGLIKKFTTDKITAATTATKNPSTLTPGII